LYNLRLRFEQPKETLLFKVAIGGQRFVNTTSAHKYKTDSVTQGIRFVQTRFQKRKGRMIQKFIDPNDFHAFIPDQIRNKRQSCCTVQSSCLTKSNELGQHVAMG
jgi:hypothetical protein